MFTVENETVIHTSLPRVWTAITRFDDYPRWHPFVRITGSLTSDTKVDYSFRMKTGNAPFRTVDARIVTVDEQRCFALRFGLGKLFALEESYLLSAIPPGARVVHSFRCTGLLSLLPLKGAKRLFGSLLRAEDRLLARHLALRRPSTAHRRRARKGFRSGA
jgi:hypothetical protein